MNAEDPFDQVQKANPHPNIDDSDPKPKTSFEAHFKEITMSDFDEPKSVATGTADRGKWRLLLAGPAMAATAALIVGVAFFGLFGGDADSDISSGRTNSTSATGADLTPATIETDKTKRGSGHIFYEFDYSIVGVPPDPQIDGNISRSTDYRFDGDRAVAVSRETYSERPADEVTTLRIGDQAYLKGNANLLSGSGYAFLEETTWPEGDQFVLLSDDLPDDDWFFNPAAARPELALSFIEGAEDFEQVSNALGEVTSTGSFGAPVLNGMASFELPAGLSHMLKSGLWGGTPSDVVELQVTTAGDELRGVKATLRDESTGDLQVSVFAATFSEFGEPQAISEPSRASSIAQDSLPTQRIRAEIQRPQEPAEDEAAIDTLDEFRKSNPTVCQSEWQAIKEIDPDFVGLDGYDPRVYQEEVLPLLMARIDCLATSGDSEVADAARQILPDAEGGTYLATAEEYLGGENS